MQSILLNPENHQDSVEEFLRFFKLPPKLPSLNYLRQLIKQFAHIPYENLSKIINLNRSPNRDSPTIRMPDTIITDHIVRRLGGTCFSLTFFLQSILNKLGFICYPVLADMRAGKNIHCCLVVLMENKKYLVDPGYLLTEPMEINLYEPKLFRSEYAGVELHFETGRNIFHLHTFDDYESKWRYSFRDTPVSPELFLQHWLASFNRNSMHGLCLTKVMPGGILFVNRQFMRETTFDGKKNFNIKRNYHQELHDRFGLDKQIIEQAQVALAANLERFNGH